jgi:thioredoxin-related protein
MKQIFCALFLCMSLSLIGQDSSNTGIQFEKNITWEQALQKAKKENKMVFLDCYTTWCVPCKVMEKKVYPQQKVGEFYNKNFICVKVQMDKTENDNEEVKSWYQQAKEIERNYKVEAYPTYLFVNADGKPLHRNSGSTNADNFIATGKEALNPETQSYMLLTKYDPDKMDTGELKRLGKMYQYKNPELGRRLLLAYVKKLDNIDFESIENRQFLIVLGGDTAIEDISTRYINSIPEADLYSRKNIDFLTAKMSSSKTRPFQIFYKNAPKVNAVINQYGGSKSYAYAEAFVDNIITKEEIDPRVAAATKAGKLPDWNKIAEAIGKKYGPAYADRTILWAKVNFSKGDEHLDYYVQYMNKYGLEMWGDFNINNTAWEIFEKTNKEKYLKEALKWSQVAVLNCSHETTGNWLDTYANILYKLGRKQMAIERETDASILDPTRKDIQENLSKMKSGQPTWPELSGQ